MMNKRGIVKNRLIDIKGVSVFFTTEIFKSIILIFLIIIFLPFANGIFHFFSAQSDVLSEENRIRLKKPEFNIKSVFPYFKKYENYYNDNFALRDFMINRFNRIKFSFFKVSPVDSVLIGKNGWLFLKKESGVNLLKYYFAFDHKARSMLVHWKDRIEERRKWAKSLGCDYIYVIVPNKQTIYPEMMPYGADRPTEESILDQIMEYVEKNGVDFIINLKREFIGLKGRRLLYQKTDTHWNELGAYFAYRRILMFIKVQLGLSVRPEPINKFIVNRHINTKGDLSGMLSLKYKTFPNNMIRLKRKKEINIKSGITDVLSSNLKITIDEYDKGILPPVLMIHDSFGEYLKYFIRKHFKVSYYSTNRNLKLYRELIKKEGIKYIIEVIAERYFIQKPPDSME